jgi:hypothetical protein
MERKGWALWSAVVVDISRKIIREHLRLSQR